MAGPELARMPLCACLGLAQSQDSPDSAARCAASFANSCLGRTRSETCVARTLLDHSPVHPGHKQAEGRPCYLQLMPRHQLITFCANPIVELGAGGWRC